MPTLNRNSSGFWRLVGIGVAVSVVGMFHAATASATNGFMSHCTGANNCGMGGAGIALPQDATGAAINPALMARVPNEVIFSPGWFHPERYRDLSKVSHAAVNAAAKNKEQSQVEDFMEGSAGFNYGLPNNFTFGVSLYGSGGMHTKYDENRMTANPEPGDSMVRFRLAHLAPTVTYAPNENSAYGVSVILGYEDFKSNFATLPANAETGGGLKTDRAYGIGMRFGGLWDLGADWTIGATASTPVFFQKFEKYDDLFVGAINTPAQAGVGVNWRVRPDTDIAVDVKYIAWGTEETLHKKPGSGGFGWESRPVFAVGVQHALTDATTLRAGWNYGPTPLSDEVVFANAMFPAITEHHFTVGASYKINEKWELAGSAFFAPEVVKTESGTGNDAFSAMGDNTEIGMWQMGAQVAVTWKF